MGQNHPSIAHRPVIPRKGRAIRALFFTLSIWTAGRLAAHFGTVEAARNFAKHPRLTSILVGPEPTPMRPNRLQNEVVIILAPPQQAAASSRKSAPSTPDLSAAPSEPGSNSPLAPEADLGPVQDSPTPEARDMAPPQHPAPPLKRRPSGSGWILIRPDRSPAGIAPQGQLGASQMGARVLLPVDAVGAGLSVSLRLSAPAFSKDGREAALGLDLAQVFGLPLSILAEGRLPIEKGGQVRPALLVVSGLYDRDVFRGILAEGYVQAGSVGISHRLPFADGHLTLTKPLGKNASGLRLGPRLGLGLWGGAQPGLARLNLGPTLIFPGKSLRISVDWRFRVAGAARPASGPSLSIGKDF